MAIARVGADAVTVAIEEITAKDWPEQVYRPDILGHSDQLYKKPGYNPLAERYVLGASSLECGHVLKTLRTHKFSI